MYHLINFLSSGSIYQVISLKIIISGFNFSYNEKFKNTIFELKKNYSSLGYSTTEFDLQIQKLVSLPVFFLLKFTNDT